MSQSLRHFFKNTMINQRRGMIICPIIIRAAARFCATWKYPFKMRNSSQIAERKTGDQQGPGYSGKDAT